MSADERARLEYEARQKAIRDHDAIMKSAWENGLESGMKQGLEQGRQSIIQKMLDNGASPGIVIFRYPYYNRQDKPRPDNRRRGAGQGR